MTARTPALEAKYQEAKREGNLQPLHEIEPIKEWTFWKLVPNKYPHNKLNVKHDMLVLKRPIGVWSMSLHEWAELYRILAEVDDQYDYSKLNLSAMRSINTTPHVHLCVYKEEYR